jgi:hypothetical protein
MSSNSSFRRIQVSLTCRQSATRYRRLFFPSEGRQAVVFFSPQKNPTASSGFEPAILGTRGQHEYSAQLRFTGARELWPCPCRFLGTPFRPSAALDIATVNPLTPELNPSAQRCLTRFFTRCFASWSVHFVNICVKNQQTHQLFIQFINYVW